MRAPARAALATFAVLLVAYVLTLAPGVAFWDAGEFATAAAVYGVPHPPGTPLYVTLGRAWVAVLPLAPAVALNLLSAVATAGAGAMLAALVARWLGGWRWGAAAGICAGSFTTLWSTATSAEVYGVALLAGLAGVWAGERAGAATDPGRRLAWSAAGGYAFALAAPLHLTMLLLLPAAALLALWPPGARLAPERGRIGGALVLAGGGLAALAVSRGSAVLGAAAVAALGGGAWLAGGTATRPAARVRTALLVPALAALALSAVAILPLRARFDPALNQADPRTPGRLADVLARRQYAVAPLWPRQAPVWLQAGNLLQWADWQVAFPLGRGPVPTPGRLAATLAFAALGVLGARAHRRRDPRSWAAVLLLLLAGGPGAAAQLNLRAGPSFGHGVLPDDAPHEARERDYFFVVAFGAWGVWAAVGALGIAAARRHPAARAAWSAVPLLPLALNWPAVAPRPMEDAVLPADLARALLRSAPQRAVLLTAGDNDSYPLWYLQVAAGLRRDVTVAPVPLLPAPWFRAELRRRDGLAAGGDTAGEAERLRTLRDAAAAAGRPLAASPLLARARLPRTADGGPASAAAGWRWRGVVRVAGAAGGALPAEDRAALAALLARQVGAPDAARVLAGGARDPRLDPTAPILRNLLLCAGLESGVLAPPRGGGRLARACGLP